VIIPPALQPGTENPTPFQESLRMTRRLFPITYVCLFAFVLVAGSAQAGTVYVPLPGLTQAGAASYEAEVTVANSAATPASVNQYLVAADTDGTQRPGPA